MENKIFTMWWQGEDNAPPIVKACIKSMREFCGCAEVIVIDKSNYLDYTEIPENVLQKFNDGKISVTHLSDIIRASLLFHVGGLWLDSTILVTQPIPEDIFVKQFYSIKYNVKQDRCIANKRWSTYLIAGRKGCAVLKLLYKFLCMWWELYDDVIDYLLTDFIINYIYDNYHEARVLIDAVEIYNYDIFGLFKQLDLSAEKDLADFGIFNKLTYKKSYNQSAGNKPTYYAELICKYGTSGQNKKRRRLGIKIKEAFGNLKRRRIKQFGFKICFMNFKKSLAPVYPSSMRRKFFARYNKFISDKINVILKNSSIMSE